MITIGADPEFVSANCPRAKYRYGELGLDGAGEPTYEIRPEPSEDANKVVGNIRAILNKTAGHMLVSGYAGPMAFGRPLGGHIHLGDSRITRCEISPEGLAKILGSAVSPIVYCAGGDACHLRRRDDYGSPDDFRRQPHGIEWRAPFSWLWDPQLARDIMWLTGAVVDIAIHHWGEIPELDPEFHYDRVDSIDELLLHCSYIDDEFRDFAISSVEMLGRIGNVVGGVLADEIVSCAQRIYGFEPLPYFANIFRRWELEPSVIVSPRFTPPAWDMEWLKDQAWRIASRLGAYQVVVYGILESRGAGMSCNGVSGFVDGWHLGGYGMYDVVPAGVIAIGLPAQLRNDQDALPVVRSALDALESAAMSGDVVIDDDADEAYYQRAFGTIRHDDDDYNEDEDDYYDEDYEEDEEEDDEEFDGVSADFGAPLPLLIPSSCYWNL